MSMFVKLFHAILDSSIADDRKLRHFFTDLLLCADSKGYVMMTEAAIARRIGATPEEVAWGIKELLRPDPKSKTPDFNGRRIERLVGTGYGFRVINFESYRALRDADQMREATRERVRRFREKKAQTLVGNDDVTQCNGSNAIKKENKKESKSKKENKEEEVVAFWNSQSELPSIRAISKGRRSHIEARLSEPFFAENWKTAVHKLLGSPFLTGTNDRGWRADFDWFIKPDSVPRIMEGKYDHKAPVKTYSHANGYNESTSIDHL